MKVTRQDKNEKLKFINIKGGDCFKLVDYNTSSNNDIFIKMPYLKSDVSCNAVSLIDGERHYIADSGAIILLNAELIISEATIC